MTALIAALFLFLAACGEDDGEGGVPDVFLGFSGFLIIAIVVWIFYRKAKK